MPDGALTIKRELTHRLARELGGPTGETISEAVTEAVRERLVRLRRERKGSLVERLAAINEDAAARFKQPYHLIEHGDLFYDERGLPK